MSRFRIFRFAIVITWSLVGASSAIAQPVVLHSEAALVSVLRQYGHAVLFVGNGSKGQYKDMAAVQRQIDQTVRQENLKYGKGKWAALFGGDHYDANEPNISHVLKYLNDRYHIPVVSIQSDAISEVDRFVKYVRFVPTVHVPVLDARGHQVIENGKPKTRIHYGGLIHGKPKGPTEVYLGDDLIGGKYPVVEDVVAESGGPVALEEVQYAYAHGLHITYNRAETRFPEVNGKYGQVDDWITQLKGRARKRRGVRDRPIE